MFQILSLQILTSDIVALDIDIRYCPHFGTGMKILSIQNPNAGHSKSGFAHSFPRVENDSTKRKQLKKLLQQKRGY